MSCFSSAVPSRLASVLRRMSVRTSMLCRLPPFSFRAPFPSFRALLGVFVSPCVRTLQFVTARALEKGARFTFLQVPVAFPPCSSLRLARALSGSHVSGATQVQPQSLLHRAPPPGYFCLLSFAARPCLSSSFHLAPFALASPAPAQHEFLHSSWLSSVLALFSLSAPCPPWIPPWLATVRVTRKLVRLAKSSREKASFSPRSWSSRATPWAA